MTISPPDKVSLGQDEPGRVLASGIDTLHLSVHAKWRNREFFKYLMWLKVLAGGAKMPYPGTVANRDDSDRWDFLVRHHGGDGYEWLLESCEYAVKVGNYMQPKQRPSVFVEIRSETLWHLGPESAVQRMCGLLDGAGADIVVVKVSRVDLCVDVLLRESYWGEHLRPLLVTRARRKDPHYCNETLTGISIGKGEVSARLYDKPLEIVQSSKKMWMYDMWGLPEVPEGHRIIRVEFQLRREPLKQVGISTTADLWQKEGGLWAYCTEDWLKVQDGPGLHHTRRKTLPWWGVVQQGYRRAQRACPLVREKGIQADLKRTMQQLCGNVVSLIAIRSQGMERGDGEIIRLSEWLPEIEGAVRGEGLTDERLTARVRKKLPRYKRSANFRWRAEGDEDILPGHSLEASHD